MMKRIHLAAVEAALRLAAGTAAAEGIGGSGFTRSGIAKPPMMTRVLTAAMREAMQAQRSPQPTYDGWSFVGGEAGRVRSPQATSATQVAARGARDDARFDGQTTADGWAYVDGETGWTRDTHRYGSGNGALVYVDPRFLQDAPALPKASAKEQARARSLIGGG